MRKHIIVVSVIAAILSVILAYVLLNTELIPYAGSTEMNSISSLMKLMASIAIVFFAIIITLIIYIFVFFRRRRGETGEGLPIKGNTPLEIVWTVIPLAIVIALSVYAAGVLNKMNEPGPPQTELEINVLAFRFGWQFEYPEYNIRSFELGLPVERRVVLHMQSRDVIHSFWVPQFGPKKDVVPGMTTELRFTPIEIGQYTLECAELCGYGHSFMTAPVKVTSAEDFQKWVQAQTKSTPAPSAPTTPKPAPAHGTMRGQY